MKLSYSINDRIRNRYYTLLSFIGVGSTLWEILIFRKTFITPSLIILIIVSTALLASIIEFRPFKRTYSYRGLFLYLGLFLTCTLSWGLISCSIYVLPNYYLADTSNSQTSEYEIIEAGSMSGGTRISSKRQPYFKIDYNGTIKQLVFSSKFLNDQEKYQSIELETAEGFFGHDIIVRQELIEPISLSPSDIIFQWAVHDIIDQTNITSSYANITSSDFFESINYDSDSLTIHLDFENEYSIEFAANGYQSKTILINTRNVPIEEQQIGYLFTGMIVDLIPLKEELINDTVATCRYNHDSQNFEFEKIKN